jgi:E3 ubiquitin-protein ligase ATL10/75/76/77/78
LSQIPVAVYGSGENILATECPICLGEFEKGDKLRMLPKCNHGFHVRCIDTWLVSHSSCPNCRLSLLEKPTVSFAGAVRDGERVAGDQLSENGSGRQSNVVVIAEQAS